jgi:NAD(P)-dependent dehydrogenase (short-subunit alcohol dehydrogenase family)
MATRPDGTPLDGPETLRLDVWLWRARFYKTRALSAEAIAKRGVRINALCPSFAATPMVDGMIAGMQHAPDEALARLVSAVPMGRTATAEEVVDAMLWICSDANSFMTGNAVALDGGLSAG